jgi:hypothetical protein
MQKSIISKKLMGKTMTICNLPETEIKINVLAYINRSQLKEAIAEQYPLVKLSDRELEQLLTKCLEDTFFKKLPEDIDWRIQKDPYFEPFKKKLAEAQLDAEEEIEEDNGIELDRHYWKDTCGSLSRKYG